MVCIRFHGPDAKGGAISRDGLQLVSSMVGSPRLLGPPEVLAKILIHGLTGPIDGKKYPGVMESMKRQDDEWMAAVLTVFCIFRPEQRNAISGQSMCCRSLGGKLFLPGKIPATSDNPPATRLQTTAE